MAWSQLGTGPSRAGTGGAAAPGFESLVPGSLAHWGSAFTALPVTAHALLSRVADTLAVALDELDTDSEDDRGTVRSSAVSSGQVGGGQDPRRLLRTAGGGKGRLVLTALHTAFSGVAGQAMILARWIRRYARLVQRLGVRSGLALNSDQVDCWARAPAQLLYLQLALGVEELLPAVAADALRPVLLALSQDTTAALPPVPTPVPPRLDAPGLTQAVLAVAMHCCRYLRASLAAIARDLVQCLVRPRARPAPPAAPATAPAALCTPRLRSSPRS